VSLGNYSILVLAVVLVTLGPLWPLTVRRLDAPARWAVAFGSAIAVLNTIVAYALIRWSATRPTVAFLRALLGGMALRIAVMLAALVTGLRLLGLPQLPLAAALLAYFVVFLALELLILQRRSTLPTGATR
jgi:hypothetical protein